jgi:cytochrome P450
MAEATVIQQVFDYANRANPFPLYAEMRKTPVSREPDGSYLVSTYWEIVSLLHDPRVSSDPENRPGTAAVPAAPQSDPGFLLTDPPLHDRLRRLTMRYFGPPYMPAKVDGMRPNLGQIAGKLVDAFANKKQIDLVDEFAYPLPVTVICQLLGVPPSDEAQFHGWADGIVDGLDVQFDPDPAEAQRKGAAAIQAGIALSQYMMAMMQRYRAHPEDNLLSGLVTGGGDDGQMTPEQALGTANLLLLAGHETTVNLIANGMLTLLRHPDILERLRKEPELIISTVEEMLRYEPSVHLLPNRSAVGDITIGGTTIPKGSAVTLAIAAGNRDPNRFPDPDRFDPERRDNQHLSFGSGIHNCFGAPVARLEAQYALSELIRRLDNPRLVVDPPEYRHSPILRGPRHLMVEVDGVLPA